MRSAVKDNGERQTDKVKDSLMYSCDANEEAEEGHIDKGRVSAKIARERSMMMMMS